MRALFAAHSIGEHETEMTIRGLFEETGMLVDPHTAVGVAASREESGLGTPMIVLSTAHAAKFPEAVERALRPSCPSSPSGSRLRLGQARALHRACPTTLRAIADFIASHARAGGKDAAAQAPAEVGA